MKGCMIIKDYNDKKNTKSTSQKTQHYQSMKGCMIIKDFIDKKNTKSTSQKTQHYQSMKGCMIIKDFIDKKKYKVNQSKGTALSINEKMISMIEKSQTFKTPIFKKKKYMY